MWSHVKLPEVQPWLCLFTLTVVVFLNGTDFRSQSFVDKHTITLTVCIIIIINNNY